MNPDSYLYKVSAYELVKDLQVPNSGVFAFYH